MFNSNEAKNLTNTSREFFNAAIASAFVQMPIEIAAKVVDELVINGYKVVGETSLEITW